MSRAYIAMDETSGYIPRHVIKGYNPTLPVSKNNNSLVLTGVAGIMILEDRNGNLVPDGIKASSMWIVLNRDQVRHECYAYTEVYDKLKANTRKAGILVKEISYCNFCSNNKYSTPDKMFYEPFPGRPPMGNNPRLQEFADKLASEERLTIMDGLEKASHEKDLTPEIIRDDFHVRVSYTVKQLPIWDKELNSSSPIRDK